MARCYSAAMMKRQTELPYHWLVSDARNDAGLVRALHALPAGSGFIFRHYHLAPLERARRFAQLLRICRRLGILAVWAGPAAEARRLGADACYGAPGVIAQGPAFPRLATAHSLREIGRAAQTRAGAVLLSPVFPTRSHPGAKVLGPRCFLALAAHSPIPVIALGGVNSRTVRRIPGTPWAAIDGLS